MLNPQSPIPLYRQLADILRDRIRSGEYAPGGRIPSEHQLAADYKIGRPTARQATDLLVRRGMLVRRRGSGTFVQEDPREVDLFSLAGTSASFSQKGITVQRRITEKIRMETIADDEHNPFAGDRAYYFERLSRVDKAPVLLEAFYIHPTLFSGIEAVDLAAGSLARTVQEIFYMRPLDGRQTFTIARLSDDRAGHLDTGPETPVLLVRRYLNFPQAKDAIYSELYCRTDRFVFSQTIGGLPHD
jgi:GntR family transcriptional regulator